MPFPPTYYAFVSVCGFGSDLLGIHSISLAARHRTAASSNTLIQGLEKIQEARGYDLAPIFALRSILYVAWTTVANLMNLHRTKKQKAATLTCLQNSWTGQSLSHCADSASH